MRQMVPNDGIDKLDRVYFARAKGAENEAISLRILNSDEMSLALGRSNVVHVAVRMNGAAAGFLAAAERLMRYRANGGREPFGDVAGTGNREVAVSG